MRDSTTCDILNSDTINSTTFISHDRDSTTRIIPNSDSNSSTPFAGHDRDRGRYGGPSTVTLSSPKCTPIPRSYDPGESDRIKLAMTRLDVVDFPFRYHGSSSLHHLFIAVDGVRGFRDTEFLSRVKASMRREFWIPPIWDVTSPTPVDIHPLVMWPHPALEDLLVNAYFDCDTHLSLLDQYTFREKLSSGLAIRDRRFSAVCWLVFANASRFVDESTTQYLGDPRSSGWAYFLAAKEAMADAQRNRPAWLPETPDEVSLQVTVLTCTWLHGTVSPHIVWLIAGSALRASQELGLHIRDHSSSSPSNSAEQYALATRRAFWCLYHLDINHCTSSGRRPVFSEGDFDFDPPLELYGSVTTSAFVQKLLLDRILGQALDKLYGVQPGRNKDVEALLSGTDHWLFALPTFLRLPSEGTVGAQSASDHPVNIGNASLAIHYHYVRLLIRRPLLPRHRKAPLEQEEALSLSLIECFAIADVLDGLLHWHCSGAQVPITSEHMYPISTTFATLHLGLEYRHDSAAVPASFGDTGDSLRDQIAERENIVTRMNTCVMALSEIERRWHYAGKLTDWVSEHMRSLCERFADGFRADLHTKWSTSTQQSSETDMGHGDVRQHYQTLGSEGLNGSADASAVDFDRIFEQLFGVNLAHM